MKITIVGTGYVGLVTGACLAEMGNKVLCVDKDCNKIEQLKKGIIPIYEPGLEDLVRENSNSDRLFFSTCIQDGLVQADICLIAVGTPMGEDGSADLHYVLEVASEIGQMMQDNLIVVDKSTVPVGTAGKVEGVINSELQKRNVTYRCSVVSNPEFLKEGSAVDDCMKPDRIIIGTSDEHSIATMKKLYAPFIRNRDRFIIMDVKSAEMTKYASNAMLSTRISFMNEIANICERVGADVNMVRHGMGSDSRIGYSFLYAGCGYGGSCFPKDVQALIKTAEDNAYDSKILKSVEEVNKQQKRILVDKVIAKYGDDLTNCTFGLWGLAFKPETDDMRQAPALVIVDELTKRGARIKAYDPKAMSEAKKIFQGNEKISFVKSKYTALDDVQALILVTEWKEFRSPDFDEMKKRMSEVPSIFDGRNILNSELAEEYGFAYYQIGKSN